VDGGLIFELERLLVEFLRGEGDDHLRPAEKQGIDRGKRLPQVILHARAAENAAGDGLQHNRLVIERLILHAGDPVDGILQPAGDRPIVLGETMISPSALRMASAQATISAGKPVAFWISKL